MMSGSTAAISSAAAHMLSQEIQAELDGLATGHGGGSAAASVSLPRHSTGASMFPPSHLGAGGGGGSGVISDSSAAGLYDARGQPSAAPGYLPFSPSPIAVGMGDGAGGVASTFSFASTLRAGSGLAAMPAGGVGGGISPAPLQPPGIFRDESSLRLQQLLLQQQHSQSRHQAGQQQPPNGTNASTSSSNAAVATRHNTSGLNTTASLSFAAGGGAATYMPLHPAAHPSSGSSGLDYYQLYQQQQQHKASAASASVPRPLVPRSASPPKPSGELFELRKALLSASAASEQLKLAVYAEQQKVMLLEHTLALREKELAAAQSQLTSDAADATNDRRQASDAERQHHTKLVQLHGDMERQAVALRTANQDLERGRVVRESLQQQLTVADNTITKLTGENDLLCDCLKRRNIQYERLKAFIVGPMWSFIDTAAKFNGQFGSVMEGGSSPPGMHQALAAGNDGLVSHPATRGEAAHDCRYMASYSSAEHASAASHRGREDTSATLVRGVGLRLHPPSRPFVPAAAADEPALGARTAAPLAPNFPQARSAGLLPQGGSSSSSTSSDDDVDPTTAVAAAANAAPASLLAKSGLVGNSRSASHMDSASPPVERSMWTIPAADPQWFYAVQPAYPSSFGVAAAAAGAPLAPAMATSGGGKYSFASSSSSSQQVAVTSKVLAPLSGARVQRLYDPASNSEVMTDDELEQRVTALLSRSTIPL